MDRMTNRRPLRTAEIIAVGSELLGSTRLDTNSLFLSESLSSVGIELRAKAVVGDNRGEVSDLFRRSLARVDLVILTGGLGPTDDDVTREAVADVLGVSLIEQADIVERLKERFNRRGLRMPEINRKQADILDGGVVLENPNGTAPGQMFEHGDQLVLLFPGPPRELKPMMTSVMSSVLAKRVGVERLYRRTIFVTGRGESHVEEIAQPIYSSWLTTSPRIDTTILAAPGQIELHLTTRTGDPEEANRVLDDARDRLVTALGPDVFSTDGRPMEEILGELLLDRHLTIAAAESCTGGLMLSRLTDVPGSSAYVAGGVVVYSNELKTSLAGVDAALIAAHGAVSEPVAVALAQGIKSRSGASIGVGITGIAGPTGGTPQKPVGTVCIAVAPPDDPNQVRTFLLFGNRTMIKFWSSQYAMNMVRRWLTEGSSQSK
jgi:nicotinamide-nucleotide amidase